MKALSIHPYFAMEIAAGEKTFEFRTWATDYRGELLICSTAKKCKGGIPGHALCVVTLADIIEITKKNCKDYGITPAKLANVSKLYAWKLENPVYIVPFAVKGFLHLWECDADIERLPRPQTPEEDDEQFVTYWEPLII